MKHMNRSALILIGCWFFVYGCGSSSGNCSYQFSAMTNGVNESEATSSWNCTSSGIPSTYTISFYTDGTGYNTAEGTFNWVETGCQQMSMNSPSGISTLSGFSGTVSSGTLSYTRVNPSQIETTDYCIIHSPN